MLWLKCCIVPFALQEAFSASVVYLVVLLAYGHPLDLLPAMAYDILSCFTALMMQFLKVEEFQDKEGDTK